MGINARFVSIVVGLCVCMLLNACAHGVEIAPPGGPPDTTAPSVVSSFPTSDAVRVTTDEVVITFDEPIAPRSAIDQVVVTPIPDEQPEVSVSSDQVSVDFASPLESDRTYVVTLGAGFTDLDGNRLGHPFAVRFSTGATIDSGTVSGGVLDVASRDAFVFAWRIPRSNPTYADTLDPTTTRPEYIAPVGDNGAWTLEALPPGHYRLVGVTDEYRNRRIDPGVDAYAVAEREADVDTAYTPVRGIMMRLPPAPADVAAPILLGASPVNATRTALRFSEPIDARDAQSRNVSLKIPTGSVEVNQAWRSPSNAAILLVSHAMIAEGTDVSVSVRDVRDTVGHVVPDSASRATFTAVSEPDTVAPELELRGFDALRGIAPGDTLVVAFDEAVRASEPADAVTITDTVGTTVRLTLARLSPATFVARAPDTLPQFRGPHLGIRLSSFVDDAGNSTDTIARIPIRVAPARQSGTLEGSIVDTAAPSAGHVVVARDVATGRVYRRKELPAGGWRFDALPEGEYVVYAFRDRDGDGEYDYGSLKPFRSAEAFAGWRGTVRVRPRWTTDKVNLTFP